MTTAEMIAGRELDALVAEHALGYRWHRSDTEPAGWPGPSGQLLAPWRWLVSPAMVRGFRPATGDESRFLDNIPHFSRQIDAAWTLVEAMALRGWKIDVQNRYPGAWACHVNFPAPDYRRVFEVSDSAALAICRAALHAVGATL